MPTGAGWYDPYRFYNDIRLPATRKGEKTIFRFENSLQRTVQRDTNELNAQGTVPNELGVDLDAALMRERF